MGEIRVDALRQPLSIHQTHIIMRKLPKIGLDKSSPYNGLSLVLRFCIFYILKLSIKSQKSLKKFILRIAEYY
jgi:hypothetical protein